MQDKRSRQPSLLTISIFGACLLGASGCSDAWRAWQDARDNHGGHHNPSADAGSADNDAGTALACGSRGLPQCAEGQYCDFPEASSCGETDRPGACRALPTICTSIYSPVCGCDGATYSSSCEAAAAGVSVRTRGKCEPSAETACGGLRGLTCADGQYCNYPPAANCGRADATGICAPTPGPCTRESRPVCGCDGTTYGNACTAAAAGVSVETQGECAPPAATCGGYAGVACPTGQYCDYAAGDGCDIADGQGRCAVQPEVCTDIYAPVCGCNGTTYGNACAAAASGSSVRAQGECPKTP